MADTYAQKMDRRTASLLSLANSILKETVNPALESAYKAVRREIADFGEIRSPYQLKRLKKAIDAAFKTEMGAAFDAVTQELNELSALEAVFAAKALELSAKNGGIDVDIAVPVNKKVEQYVAASIMSLNSRGNVVSGQWDEFTANYSDAASKRIQSVITNLWNQGNLSGNLPTINQMSSAIRQVNDGLNKQKADTLVRTAVNHFSQQGRAAFRDENLDVIEREYPIVTFDNRTSYICISISDKYGQKGWKVGDAPNGYPPYHYNCRTTIGFMLPGQTEPEGTKASVGGKDGELAEERFNARKDRLRKASQVRYRGKKDSDVFDPKQISAATPISKWLASQPDWYIKDTLGQTNGQAFIDGKLDLTKLTDKDLKPRTIQELALEE